MESAPHKLTMREAYPGTSNLVSDPSQNRGPMMMGVLWALFFLCGAIMWLRVHVRYSQARVWWDDYLMIAGWLFMLVETILIQVAVSLGYGKHMLDINQENLATIQYYGASNLSISILAINSAKISFAVTLLPLTSNKMRWFLWFIIGSLASLSVPIIVLPWVQCRPLLKTYIDSIPGECLNKTASVNFAIFQAIWAASTDVILALLPWKIVWNLNMRPIEKIGVGIAMSLGVFAGATSIMRSMYLSQLLKADISYDAAEVLIWSATEVAATIIAASLPVLRKFFLNHVNSAIDSYKTKYGVSKADPSGSGNASNGRSNASRSKGSSFSAISRIKKNKSDGGDSQGTWLGLTDIDPADTDSRVGIMAGHETMDDSKSQSRVDTLSVHGSHV